MKKTIMVLIALLLTLSCAGIQETKKEAPTIPNYTGTWTGPVYVQGQAATLILALIQEGDKITGTISDGQGQMPSTEITNAVLKDKVLSFSVPITSPQGTVLVNFTGTFSEDNKEYALYFEVSGMQFSGNATLKKS